jgi:hypothetical protein
MSEIQTKTRNVGNPNKNKKCRKSKQKQEMSEIQTKNVGNPNKKDGNPNKKAVKLKKRYEKFLLIILNRNIINSSPTKAFFASKQRK